MVGAYVGPYLSFPLIGLPFTQCQMPNNHKFCVSVGFTAVARIDFSMLTS